MMNRLTNYVRRLDERLQERRLGIATAELHEQIVQDRPEFRGYAPTSYRDWRTIKRQFVAKPNGAFIDYGAGLGRVTILAAQLPFGRVIGVELDPDLVARGNENITRAKVRTPAQIVCADATSFDVPADASTVFFCNPFTGSILFSVLDRIQQSFAATPRLLKIVCNLPHQSTFETDIASVNWLKRTDYVPLGHDRKCLVFSPS